MERKKIKFSNNLIYLIIVVIAILMLVLGKSGEDVDVLEENQGLEESTGSGFLDIETLPGGAEIFLDDSYNGLSPLTIYNIPAGIHNVVIKKEGYEDFVSEVSVEAGRKTFLEASLVLTKTGEVEIIETIEEAAEVIEIVEEEIPAETPKPGNIVNIGEKFLLYYDFSEKEFTDKRNLEQDIFSQRYAKHLVFTRINPASIKTIDKGIDSVEKGDCIGVSGSFEYLYSGKSLCFITKENQIGALGGTWDDTENAELKWKLFS